MSDVMNPESDYGAITEPMITSMKQASSWIRFLSICGFVYAGLVLVPMLLMAILFPIIGTDITAELGIAGGVFGVLFLFFGIIFAVAVIIPLRFLYSFGSKMKAYVQTSNDSALELAFKNNYSFWKFCGILTIVLFALMFISIIITGVSYV
jgi:hypothetical protein